MMRPAARMGLLIVLTIGGVLPMATFLMVPSAHGMVRFNSYMELQRFLLLESSCRYNYGIGYGGVVLGGAPRDMHAVIFFGFAGRGAGSYTVTYVPPPPGTHTHGD